MALIKMASTDEEYKKNKELNDDDIKTLQQWLQKQPHLPKISDLEMILFLYSNYYRVEPTKTAIDAFYTVKTHASDIFSNRDPIGSKSLREIMDVVYFIVLPGTTAEGYKVIYAHIIDCDPSRYIFADVLRYFSMAVELSLLTQGTSPGHIILFNMTGVVFGHVARLNPLLLKKYFYYLQEALPVRLKGLHFMNAVPFMDTILNVLKPFMKKELLDVLAVHTTLENVAKSMPVDILPNEAGGKAGSLKDLHEASANTIREHAAWFQDDEARSRVNENLRPGKAKSATDLFGVEGSFKKLNID